MLVTGAKIGFYVCKLRQSAILDISKVLAQGRNMRSVHDQSAAGILEDEFVAVSERFECGRRATIGIGMREIDLPGNVIVVQKLENCLRRELGSMVIRANIENIALRGAARDACQPVGYSLA